MSDNHSVSRRDALRKSLLLGSAVGGVWLLAGCGKKELVCSDTSGLKPEEIQLRTTLGYVDKSTQPDKLCETCVQWKPAPGEGQCGGCNLLKGSIHPKGYCNSWAKKG